MSRNRRPARPTLSRVPSPPPSPDLAEALEKIDRCRRLQADWDGEGALPIQEEVAARTTTLLSQVAEEAVVLGLQWQSPAIAPSPDGALELSWEVGNRWAMLVVSPGQVSIECVTQEGSSPPRHSQESHGDAVQLAIWALRHARSEAGAGT
jgi:hypothetical protein